MTVNRIFSLLFELLSENDAEEQWLIALSKFNEDGGDVCVTNPSNGWSILHYASENTFLEVTEWLISKGVDVNLKDNEGGTPYLVGLDSAIDAALQYGEPSIDFSQVKLLLVNGADSAVSAKNGLSRDSILDSYGSGAEDQYNRFVTSHIN